VVKRFQQSVSLFIFIPNGTLVTVGSGKETVIFTHCGTLVRVDSVEEIPVKFVAVIFIRL
jgi:hypothetical protein